MRIPLICFTLVLLGGLFHREHEAKYGDIHPAHRRARRSQRPWPCGGPGGHPAGRIYVLESDAHRVRVFAPTGAYVATIGREGSGPGEFRNPAGMTWGPDGHLWVIDPGNSRASIFDPDGGHVRDQRLEAGFELAPWPGRFDRSGRLYHYTAEPSLGEFGYVMVLVG